MLHAPASKQKISSNKKTSNKRLSKKGGWSQQRAATCSNSVEFRAALGELARLTADVRILLFGIQSCAVMACKPQEGVVGFAAQVT